VSIAEEDLPLDFSLSRKNNEVLLHLKESRSFVPLTEKGVYFYYMAGYTALPKNNKNTIFLYLQTTWRQNRHPDFFRCPD